MVFTLSGGVRAGVSELSARGTVAGRPWWGAAFTAVVAAKLASVRRALNRRPGLGKGQAHVLPPESKGFLIVASGRS